MSSLFYKDLQSHQKSYREVRADEAVNDLILGSKVNALNNLEDAKNNIVDEIAINYGKFLKALKTKNLPLLSQSTNEENRITEVAKASQERVSVNHDNMLMPSYGSASETASLSEPTSSVIAKLSADLTPEQQKINAAYNIAMNEKNVPSMLRKIKDALGGNDSVMVKNFEFIMHENGYSARTNKKSSSGKKAPTGDAMRNVMEAMQQQYFKPV